MTNTGPEPEHQEDLDPDQARDEARRKEADTDGGHAGTEAGPVHSAHGPARSRRSFRRKSG